MYKISLPCFYCDFYNSDIVLISNIFKGDIDSQRL